MVSSNQRCDRNGNNSEFLQQQQDEFQSQRMSNELHPHDDREQQHYDLCQSDEEVEFVEEQSNTENNDASTVDTMELSRSLKRPPPSA